MIATCPACGKRYRLPDDAVPAVGRNVRCAACGHGWVVLPDGSTGAALPPAATPVPARLEPAGSGAAAATPPPAKPPEAPAFAAPPVPPSPPPARPAAAPAPAPPVAAPPPPPTAAPASLLPAEPMVETGPPPLRHSLLRTEPLPEPQSPMTAPLSFTAMRDAMTPPPPRRRGFVWIALLVLLVVALGALAVVEFAPAGTFVPPRLGLPAPETVFAAMPDLPPGLKRVPVIGGALDRLANPPPAPPSPLKVTVRGQRSVLGNGTRVMTVTGTLSNPTGAPVAVERIDAALLDHGGHALYRWRIDAPGEIAAHASAPIESVAANYPAAATVLQLTPR